MNKHLIPIVLIIVMMGSCAPAPTSSSPPAIAAATHTILPSHIPQLTQTAISTATNFSFTQIRMPNDTDGRQVLTAFWSQDEMTIYYALINEIGDTPVWFEILLGNGQNFQNKQLSSPPQLTYTPSLPVGGVYLEYQGLVSPSKRFGFQIIKADNYSLYFLDNMERSKFELLETPDMNFRGAFWTPSESSVVFGIGPEYGTFLYLYGIRERRLLSFEELVGNADPNVSEWALSPDGKSIAILGENLNLYSLDGSFSTTIVGYQSHIRWAGNSNRIYFYYGDQLYNPTNIGYFDIPTQSTQDLMPLSTLEQFGVQGFFDVSLDGNQLVFWQAGKIWLLSFE